MRRDDDDGSDYAAPVRKKRRASHNHIVTTKSARAHTKSYRPGPPIAPHVIVQKLLDYVAKIQIRKRQPFIERLCRYWSLKREARRGAPLLKRLHLEVHAGSRFKPIVLMTQPWTASSESRHQTESEKAQKLKVCLDCIVASER